MKTVLLLTVILLWGLPHLAVATETAAPATPAAERPLSPMMLEIETAVGASHEAVAELSRRLDTISVTEDIVVLQKEILRIKTEGRLEILRIQLRHAVAEERAEDVARLESVISVWTTPSPAMAQTRPAPAQAGQR